jgi:hypothetical protein
MLRLIFLLQANFQIDCNPDGQDLERIADISGLSKRVVQVQPSLTASVQSLVQPSTLKTTVITKFTTTIGITYNLQYRIQKPLSVPPSTTTVPYLVSVIFSTASSTTFSNCQYHTSVTPSVTVSTILQYHLQYLSVSVFSTTFSNCQYHTSVPSSVSVSTILQYHLQYLSVPYFRTTFSICQYHTSVPSSVSVSTILQDHLQLLSVPSFSTTFSICQYHTSVPPSVSVSMKPSLNLRQIFKSHFSCIWLLSFQSSPKQISNFWTIQLEYQQIQNIILISSPFKMLTKGYERKYKRSTKWKIACFSALFCYNVLDDFCNFFSGFKICVCWYPYWIKEQHIQIYVLLFKNLEVNASQQDSKKEEHLNKEVLGVIL